MKFCKNLQRVVDISDPEWAPFWMNYKMLKKLIKESPSDNTASSPETNNNDQKVRNQDINASIPPPPSPPSPKGEGSPDSTNVVEQPNKIPDPSSSPVVNGDDTNDTSQLQKLIQKESFFQTRAEVVASLSVSKTAGAPASKNENEIDSKDNTTNPLKTVATAAVVVKKMEKNPSEVLFFKQLHIELRKVVHFFAKTEEEFKIREERIRLGIDIMTKYDRTMGSDRWSSSAKSLYRLYKDLLLLETYAIMTYCSFSKILKKHDKVTGYSTRNAYMSNIVSKANFSSYPNLIKMISRCEDLYQKVSAYLASEGRRYSLQDDERLFINTIRKLNEQVIVSTNDEDGHLNDISERRDKSKLTSLVSTLSRPSSSCSSNDSCSDAHHKGEKAITSSLKQLVQEDERKAVTVVATADDDDSSTSSMEKRKTCYTSEEDEAVVSKRLCTEKAEV